MRVKLVEEFQTPEENVIQENQREIRSPEEDLIQNNQRQIDQEVDSGFERKSVVKFQAQPEFFEQNEEDRERQENLGNNSDGHQTADSLAQQQQEENVYSEDQQAHIETASIICGASTIATSICEDFELEKTPVSFGSKAQSKRIKNHSIQYGCDTCGLRFNTLSLLNAHSTLCGKSACRFCHKRFTNLEKHVARMHSNGVVKCKAGLACSCRKNVNNSICAGSYNCDLCGKKYTSQYHFTRHRLKCVTDGVYKGLHRHFTKNDDVYSCNFCTREFKSELRVRCHLDNYHGLSKTLVPESVTPLKFGKRKYTDEENCMYCLKKFQTRFERTLHVCPGPSQ